MTAEPLTAEQLEYVAAELDAAYAAGAAAERESVVKGLRTVAACNGSGAAVLKAVTDDSGHEHDEGTGRFTGTGGGSRRELRRTANRDRHGREAESHVRGLADALQEAPAPHLAAVAAAAPHYVRAAGAETRAELLAAFREGAKAASKAARAAARQHVDTAARRFLESPPAALTPRQVRAVLPELRRATLEAYTAETADLPSHVDYIRDHYDSSRGGQLELYRDEVLHRAADVGIPREHFDADEGELVSRLREADFPPEADALLARFYEDDAYSPGRLHADLKAAGVTVEPPDPGTPRGVYADRVLDALDGAAGEVVRNLLLAWKSRALPVGDDPVGKATRYVESEHPRDKAGQFIPKGDIDAARAAYKRGDKGPMEALRERVKPEHLDLLNAHLAREGHTADARAFHPAAQRAGHDRSIGWVKGGELAELVGGYLDRIAEHGPLDADSRRDLTVAVGSKLRSARLPVLRKMAKVVGVQRPDLMPLEALRDEVKAKVAAALWDAEFRCHAAADPDAGDEFTARWPVTAKALVLKAKFASTQIQLPPEMADRLLALGRQIPDEDLGEDGREDDAHVTVKYGLHDDDPAAVRAALTGRGPVRFRLGAVTVFDGAENDKPYDVLKVDVESEDLHRLNAILCELPHTDTFPDYRPHATIAYVKAGKGAEYARRFGTLGMSGAADEVVFSDTKKKRTAIPLAPAPVAKSLDAAGHEHRGKGPGGGQFTRSGGATAAADAKAAKKPSGAKRTNEEAPRSDKAARAKAAAVRVDADIQRYAEEHSEPKFARAVGGVSFPNGEPVDVVSPGKDGKVAHGVELKTMVVGKDDKLTMNSYAQVRKIEWERAQGATFHTVVLDDRLVKDAKGPGRHDESKRAYYYRRGVAGSARLGSLHRCADFAELRRLMAAPEKDLPPAAARTDGKLRVGRWKFFTDADGKGYKNSKTGQVFRAKK